MSLASRLVEWCKDADGLLGSSLSRWEPCARRAVPERAGSALLVRLWGLGNLVLLAPHLAANSDRRLRLLTLERNAPFVRACLPDVELLTVPAPYLPGFLPAVRDVARTLRREPPDVVVDLEQFLRLPVWLARRATGAPCVGLDTPGQGRRPLLDRAVTHDPTRHVAHTFAALAAAAGLAVGTGPGPLRVGRAALARLDALLGPLRAPRVVVHPGSGDHFPGRRWSPERFGRLARILADEHGVDVLVTGTPGERELVRRVVVASGGRARDLAGRLGPHEMVALLAAARLLVTNDTGPLHMADALGTRAVALYGPNTPHRYGPRRPGSVSLFADLPCSPCLDDRTAKRSSCRHFACMEALDLPLVLRACVTALELDTPRGPSAALLRGTSHVVPS